MLKIWVTFMIIFLLSNGLVADENNSTKKATTHLKKNKILSGKNLVIVVSSGDLQVAGMGFGLALSGVKQGANVTIVIGANAIKYLLKEGDQNIYFAKGRTPRYLLQSALKSGVEIQVCSANSDEMNLDEDDFIDGVKLVISTEIFTKVFEEGTRVISF